MIHKFHPKHHHRKKELKKNDDDTTISKKTSIMERIVIKRYEINRR